MSNRRIVGACEKRKEDAVDAPVMLHKVDEEGHKVRVEAYVAEWSVLRGRVAYLTSRLESRTLELQAMPRLASEAAWLRQ